jgi:2-dehydropantoate 2-reductase
MKILIIGAGVIGSTYGFRFIKAGHQVTFLEKGTRLLELSENGLSICHDSDNEIKNTYQFRLINSFSPDESYDLILVTVRYDQLNGVLDSLKNTSSKNILFMLNNPGGSKTYLRFFDQAKIVLGFPGVGGKKEYGIIHYHILSEWIQPTTFGEIGGQRSERIIELKKIFLSAGFPVSVNRNMDTWYLTHLAVVCPLANAIYLDGGNNYSLAKNKNILKLLVKTLKESLNYVNHSKGGINPVKFKLLTLIPEVLLVKLLAWILNTRWAETVISSHSLTASTEMENLSQDFISMAREEGYQMSNFKKLMFNDRIDQKIEKLLWISSIFFSWLL